VGDVVKMLVTGRNDPGRSGVDYDGDGLFGPADIRALLEDILSGGCPESYPGL
jgi:hypothetical protein